MITAIIFDCFGVLTTDGWLPLKREFFGTSGPRYDEATELNKQVDHGIIGSAAFAEKIAALAGIEPAEVERRLRSNVPNKELLELIEHELSGHYKLGMLSNAGAYWLDRLFSPSQLELFDAVALSFEIHAIKPQPRAYEIIAERLQTPLDQCLLVDDQLAFCEGAEQVGMQAIHYTSLETLAPQLKRQLHRA